MSPSTTNVSQRLFSLDVFRGLTMLLLIAEAAGFHGNFSTLAEGLLAPIGLPQDWIMVINALFVLFIFWYLTYFLDKKKVYFKV